MPRSLARRAAIAAVALVLSCAGCGNDFTRKSSTVRTPPSPDVSSKSDPKRAAEINLGLAQGYFGQGNLKDAMTKVERAIQLDPKLAGAHTLMALIDEQINRMSEADFHHKRAVELEPKNGAFHNNYGAFLCRQGRFDEADASFAKALADPFYETPQVALGNRGSCALSAGKADVAEQSLRAALKLRPDDHDVMMNLARALYVKGDLLKARAFAQRCVDSGKPTAEALDLALQIEQKLGNDGGIQEYRTRLMAEFPNSDQARRLVQSEGSK